MPDANTSERRRLTDAVKRDIADRKEWSDTQREYRENRLRKKSGKRLPYPGAPDLVEPIIDDNIVSLTSAENTILWSTRALATFLPLSSEGYRFKSLLEHAFDTLLRVNLSLRAKIENLFDTKNESGFGLAKLTTNDTVIPGALLPDFEPMDPRDVVVPKGTRHLRDADRVTCIYRYTEREFRERAAKYDWRNVDEVIERLGAAGKQGTGEEPDQDEYGVLRSRWIDNEGDNSEPEIVVWYVYHYRRTAEAYSRWVEVLVPDEPDFPLKEYPWKWPDSIRPAADATGMPVMDELGQPMMTTDVGPDRRWPLVQFRFENRSLQFYDTRGVSDKLENNQREATANKNAKLVVMDYTAKPFVSGPPGVMRKFRWRPGESLPAGVELIIPPRVDPIFDYNMDMARNTAARRVGAPQGAFSSVDKTREAKTATEVSQTALTSNRLSSDAVERFAEPLGELFQMMWEHLQYFPPTGLMAVVGDNVTPVPPEAFQQKYIVVPGISGRSANPDLILRQLMVIAQVLAIFPQAGQFFKGAEIAQFLIDQIDPKLTPHLVVTPEQAGQGTAPIEQQVARIIQMLTGNEQQRGLIEQAHANSEMLTAMAQESLAKDENEKLQRKVENRAPENRGRGSA